MSAVKMPTAAMCGLINRKYSGCTLPKVTSYVKLRQILNLCCPLVKVFSSLCWAGTVSITPCVIAHLYMFYLYVLDGAFRPSRS